MSGNLYDLAYQKYVVEKATEGENIEVKAYLVLVNKNAIATEEGLNQMFKIEKEDERIKVEY